jgi:hypothetical protein
MRNSFVRQRGWTLFVLVSAVLCAGCQSATSSVYYGERVDACGLPGPGTLAKLAPGTVEIPPSSVKTADAKALPAERSIGEHDVTGCERLFARDLGGGKPDLHDYRLITIAVVRFTGSDDDQAAAGASQLMTGALGDHSGVRIAGGVGEEAGISEQWAAVRTGNVVLGLAIADGGTEAALIPPPTVDNVQAVVTDLAGALRRDYRS